MREWGEDEEVRAGLIGSITWIHGTYSDRRATLAPRLERLDTLLRHEDPAVADLAQEARTALQREMESDW